MHRERIPVRAWIAIAILTAVVVLAVVGGQLAPYDPLAQQLDRALEGPSSDHLLGTDYLGRDTLSRLLAGTQDSVWGALVAVAVGAAFGVVPGMLSVFVGRGTTFFLLRFVDALMTLPFIVFALAVAAVFGNTLTTVMIGIGVLFVPRFFRVTRAATLALAKAEYVEAAELVGATRARIVRVHVALKVMPTILVTAAQTMASALLVVASLTFLGLGVPPPNPTWGGMLGATLPYLAQRPFDPFVPAAAIVATVLALNLLADNITSLVRRRRPGAAGAGEVLATTQATVESAA
jgi:peptide/nickel transport system permease protein